MRGDAGLLEPLLTPEAQTSARRIEVELPEQTSVSLIVETARAAEALLLELVPSRYQ
jgi:hypothetical protein